MIKRRKIRIVYSEYFAMDLESKFFKNLDYIKMIELTRNQKIGFGFAVAGVLAITFALVLYFVVIKKDTPKPPIKSSGSTKADTDAAAKAEAAKAKALADADADADADDAAEKAAAEKAVAEKAAAEKAEAAAEADAALALASALALNDAIMKRADVKASNTAFTILLEKIKNQGEIPDYIIFGKLDQAFEKAEFTVKHEKLALLSVQAQTKLSSYPKYFDPIISEEVTREHFLAKISSTTSKTLWQIEAGNLRNKIRDSGLLNTFDQKIKFQKEKLGLPP
jgi:hypothetical protein